MIFRVQFTLAVQGASFGLFTVTLVMKQFAFALSMVAIKTPVVALAAEVVGSAVVFAANCNSAVPVMSAV